ncbi:ATP-dependent zinc protease family protein [Marinimicrobium sp. ARAG 43.8]|uniref:ATP-dependent zinc protease family protein n=1 Tax=Marinimicrobium sp. ARAG 43.8 TaxID=3418719 RepID=UPI003CF9F033
MVSCPLNTSWMNLIRRIRVKAVFRKSVWVVAAATVLSACSSGHVLVKKSDMEAANQCLLSQQKRDESLVRQQEQMAETLSLLQKTVEMQQQGDTALRDFIQVARQGLDDEPGQLRCPPASTGQGVSGNQNVLDKKIVGATERVLLTDLGIVLQSRVDTGATTSSLDARDIEIFERNGEEWVRFKIQDPDMEELVELERPRSRKVRIVQANSEETESRPVVEMRITMGSLTQMAEFTLSDRSHMEYPMLIGRNILRDLMLVDVAQDNVTEPQSPTSATSRNSSSSRNDNPADESDSE